MPIRNPKITAAGVAAAIAADGLGVSLKITHITAGAGAYTPTGSETAMVDLREVAPVLVGARVGSQLTLTATLLSALYAGAAYDVGEIGFWAGDPNAGGVLFAVDSAPGRAYPKRGGTYSSNFTANYSLALSGVPSGSVDVIYDPDAAVALIALATHVAAANPHPQYLLKAGGTLTGPLVLAAAGSAPLHPATVQQLTDALAAFVSIDSQTIKVGPKYIKYGTTGSLAADTGAQAVTFTNPFPTACAVVLLTGSTNNGVGSNENYSAGIYDKTAAGFKINNDSMAGTFDWIAIGS
jgi:hypothetical protein